MAGSRIGAVIRKRRQVLGMTQDELAARVGVSKSAVGNWERGKHFPLRYLGAVEAVLGIDLDGDQPPAAELVPAGDWERWVWEHPDIPDRIKRDLILRARAESEPPAQGRHHRPLPGVS